jgi:hypothetical protein
MVAADAFSYAGLKEMRSYEIAMNTARKLNENATEPTKGTWAVATELLNKTSERVAIAEAQATQEGLTGVEYKRRVWELMEQGRTKEMVEDAAHFAALGTFNYSPEGTLGMMTEAVSHLTQNAAIKIKKPFSEKYITVRPGKFIVPFTRIIANVTNMALDYYPPIGLSRWALGGIGAKGFVTKKFYRKYTTEERQKVLIKAMVGITAQATFFLLSEPDDDGDEAVAITANGYGDYQKNYELKETGWQPYSIKIGGKWVSYQYTPLILALAPIGYYRDMQKYNKEKVKDKTMATMIGLSYFKGMQVINDMTWASSLNSIMDAFKAKEPSQAQGYLTNLASSTAKSFIYPKLAEQITQLVDAAQKNPKHDGKDLVAKIMRDIPIVRGKYNTMLNAVGEPVMYDPFQMISTEKADPFWEYLTDKNITIGKPNAREVFYDDISKTERAMTGDEYYDFVKTSGREIKRRIENEVMPKDFDLKETKKEIDNIKSDVRRQLKTEMFGWGDFRKDNPKEWLTLKNNGAIQIPVTTAIEWITDEGKTKATKEEMVKYNKTAMQIYSESVLEYLNEDAEEDKKDVDPLTGEITYNTTLGILWSGAKEAAKGEVIDARESKPAKVKNKAK